MANKVVLFSEDCRQVRDLNKVTLTKVEGTVESAVAVDSIATVKLPITKIGNTSIIQTSGKVIKVSDAKVADISGSIGIISTDREPSGLTVGNNIFTTKEDFTITQEFNPKDLGFTLADSPETAVNIGDIPKGEYIVISDGENLNIKIGEDVVIVDGIDKDTHSIIISENVTPSTGSKVTILYYVPNNAQGEQDIVTWIEKKPFIDYIGTIPKGKYEITIEDGVSYIIIESVPYRITYKDLSLNPGYLYINWSKNAVLEDMQIESEVKVLFSSKDSVNIRELIHPHFFSDNSGGLDIQSVERGIYELIDGWVTIDSESYRIYSDVSVSLGTVSSMMLTGNGYVGIKITEEEFTAYLSSFIEEPELEEPSTDPEPEPEEPDWEDKLIDSRSSVIELPGDILMIVNEMVKTKNGKSLTVVPLSAGNYALLMNKPFKRPLKNQAWRLLNSVSENNNKFAEVITNIGDEIDSYKVRYVRRPKPIILAELGDLSIENESHPSECELDPILHREILQRAVELGKALYAGDLNTTIALGTNSATELGMLASPKQQ